jgi:hypothetical protein
MIRRRVLRLLCGAPVALLGACAYYAPGPRPVARPLPAWARPKMVWDPGLSVFVVVGSPGVYYLEPNYYRWRDGRWLYSRNRHDWYHAPRNRLPPGLAKSHGRGRKH